MYTSFKQLGDLLENPNDVVPTVLIENGRAAVEDLLRRYPGLADLGEPAVTLTPQEALDSSQNILEGLAELVGSPTWDYRQIKQDGSEEEEYSENSEQRDASVKEESPSIKQEASEVSDKDASTYEDTFILTDDESSEIIEVLSGNAEEIDSSDEAELIMIEQTDDMNLTYISKNYREDVVNLLMRAEISDFKKRIVPEKWSDAIEEAYQIGKVRDNYFIYLVHFKNDGYFIMASRLNASMAEKTISHKFRLWLLLFEVKENAEKVVDASIAWNEFILNNGPEPSQSIMLPPYQNKDIKTTIKNRSFSWVKLNKNIRVKWGGIPFDVSGVARKYENKPGRPFVVAQNEATHSFFIIFEDGIDLLTTSINPNQDTQLFGEFASGLQLTRDFPVAEIVS